MIPDNPDVRLDKPHFRTWQISIEDQIYLI